VAERTPTLRPVDTGPQSISERVHLPRLADVVAERIRDAILRGDLRDGERLPPLETLLTQFGVSAPSMREALRVLEAEGLIAVQRGGIGGAIIRRPTARTAAYTLALVLRSQGTRKNDVSAAVALLEPLYARLCARRPDRRNTVVRELRSLNRQAAKSLESDPVSFNDTMVTFHRTMAKSAGNDTLALVTRSLEHIWLADLHAKVSSSIAHGNYPDVTIRRHELDYHIRITDLIADGDEQGAEATMSEHLAHSSGAKIVDFDEPVDPKTVRFNAGAD
jgi:GntR family transcriptional repressor for pyruvate dehydrogenase complex